MNQKQLLQDNEYEFPYHYIPQFKNGFLQNLFWSWGKNYISAVELLLDELTNDLGVINSIADIGCGDGRLTYEISNLFPNKDVVGIDYSNRAINLGKALNPNVNFQTLDITKDEIVTKYDAITLMEVFEHIPQNQCHAFVNALHKLLNNNGYLYITVPHVNKPLSKKHFQHFSCSSLLAYFEGSFVLEKVLYIQRSSKFLKLLNLLMYNKVYIIQNKFLNEVFYKFYKKRFFYAQSKNCGRIYMKLRKN